ncbi:MAG: DUF2723 domain-containing protein [Acidobacteriaceae bacterium]
MRGRCADLPGSHECFGIEAARFAGLIFLFSPLAWFHATVALTYIVEAFFSALVGFLCWRMESGNRRMSLPASLILGISAGIRPEGAGAASSPGSAHSLHGRGMSSSPVP